MLVSEIQTRVKNLFGDTAGVQITDTMMLDWVNDGQKDICRKAECLEGSNTQNIVAGTDNYAYPADFIKEQRLTVNGIKLTRVTMQALDQLYPDRAVYALTGNPWYYFHWNRKFNLYPSPVSSATAGLVVWYIRYAAEVTVGADTPEIPRAFHEDLVRYCFYRALEQDEQWVPAQSIKQDYDARLLNTIYDSQVEQADEYPSVRLVAGD